MDNARFSRVFEVLELVVAHPGGLTLTEISRHLDLPTSSGHNLLQRMVNADVLTVTDGPRYAVGGRAVRLGVRILDGLELRAVARRHLHELSRATGEDAYLAVPVGDRVVCVDRVPGSRPVGVEIRLGQALRGELARIRGDGHAVSREVPGVLGLAVPVRDAHGTVAAAVHISTLRADADRERALVAAARTTAGAIERELGRPLDPPSRPGLDSIS